MQKMTLDELRQYVETMPEGIMIIVEFGEVVKDGNIECADRSSHE